MNAKLKDEHMNPLHLRLERPEDLGGIRKVHELAFGRREEADLVDRMRENGGRMVSVVAELKGRLVGHVLFSEVQIHPQDKAEWTAWGLAPMAVVPDHSRQGIGSALARRGLQELQDQPHALVFVLGDPSYYRRFGFLSAHQLGYGDEYEAPKGAFQVFELRPKALKELPAGLVKFRPEFADAVS
ncbi:MAG: N-acetyltransferase [Planctomycetota bacterium]|nr:MAG: N-acetyltransferase [Planctomycetota bacterium]